MAFNILGKFTGNTDEPDTYTDIDENENTLTRMAKNNTMILLEPRAYSESQQIADYLKNNSSVIVNLKRVTPDQAKRIVDFLSGTIYAIGGDLQKLGGGIFLCTPNTINVEGKITDDGTKGKEKAKEKAEQPAEGQEEDEFSW